MWDTLHESFYIFNNWIHYIIYEICVYEFLTWPEECSLSIEPINLLSKTKTVEHVSWGWGNFEGLLLSLRLLDCLSRTILVNILVTSTRKACWVDFSACDDSKDFCRRLHVLDWTNLHVPVMVRTMGLDCGRVLCILKKILYKLNEEG